jgi:5-methylcytosine-specific restriction endonuclease McrA
VNGAEYSRRYRERHRDVIRERRRKLREANPEKYRERNRSWREANPEKTAEADRRWSQMYRTSVFGHYGWSCACCGAADDLTIDHVKPREGAKLVGAPLYRWLIADSFPEGFQTLCRPCNRSKARRDRCRLDHSAKVRQMALAESNGHRAAEPAG